MGEAISLQDVERLIATRSFDPSASPRLELQVERDLGQRRARFLRTSTLRAIPVYTFFLFGDAFLTPDVLGLSAILHFLVVTPYMLLVAFLIRPGVAPREREVLAASIPLAIVLQVLIVFCATNSPFASHYLYFVTSAVVSLSAVQRVRLRYARICAALVFALLLAALLYKGTLPIEITVTHAMIYVVCVTVTLNSNKLIAREQRWHYLMALRERLRAAESDDDANHDPLTGLGNRRFLHKQAADLWRAGARDERSIAAIVFDVDHFKAFNDRYGHGRGDACLKRIAACASAELRLISDLAFRTGGEEFLALLPGVELETAIGVAERIRMTIEGLGIPHEGGPGGIVTASFGVAAGRIATCSLEALAEAADEALYVAKRGGRNRTRAHTAEARDMAA
ncbi:MAG: GGDEF domain-containing protein [Beijerinckiaceae bacterium]